MPNEPADWSLAQIRYIPGSLVRVELSNFVTYDHVVFHPGPYLNMIIGPNGTGKSTIACAIALGFGFPPNVLGREQEVGNFVKQGQESGWIELELKGANGEANVVIRRHLVAGKRKHSDFFLNGSKTTFAAVKEKREELEVNVDNLCSFLPQDRVAEFARMSPEELLRETQKAASDGGAMVTTHDRIIALSRNLRETNATLRKQNEELDALQGQHSRLARDAERHAERKDLVDRILVNEVAIKVAEVKATRTKWQRLKVRKAVILEQIAEFEGKMKPLKEHQELLQDKAAKIKANTKKVEMHRKTTSGNVDKVEQHITKQTKAMEKAERDLQALTSQERNRQSEIEETKAEVARLEHLLSTERPSTDTTEIDEELRRIRGQVQQISSKRREHSQQVGKNSKAKEQILRNKEVLSRKKEQLTSVRHMRMESLRSSIPRLAKAIDWLRANQQQFKGKVYEPAILSLEVKHEARDMVDAIENCFTLTSLCTIICEYRADYDLVNRKLNDEMNLRVSIAEIEASLNSMGHQHPYPLEKIRNWGFDDYCVNLITGPSAVIEYMCQTSFIHCVPIARDQRRVDMSHLEKQSLIRNFKVGEFSYRLTMNEYTRSIGSSSSMAIMRAKNLVHTVDQRALAEVMQEMQEIAHESEIIQQEIQRATQVQAEIDAEDKEIQKAKAKADQRREELVAAEKQWNRAEVELAGKRAKLQRLLGKANMEATKARLRKELADASSSLTKAAQDLKGHRLAQWNSLKDYTILKLADLQTTANLEVAREIIEKAQEEGAQIEAEAHELKRRLFSAKKRFIRATEELQEATKEIPGRLQTRLGELAEKNVTLQELEEDTAKAQGILDGIPEISSDIIRRFEEKKRKIEELEVGIANAEQMQSAIREKLDKRVARWEPKLEALVNKVNAKFSAAFDRFQCAGEVKLSRGPSEGVDSKLNFESWCIEIRVKFRQSEELQLLTASRQSGGERSLSTILYLMSLTELGASPFSLVDEINQGMDQRSERLVHDHMVHTTCRAKASQ